MPGFVAPLVLEKNKNLDLSFQAGTLSLDASSKTSGHVSFDAVSLESLSQVSVWDQLEAPSIQAAFQKIKAASLILERVLKTEGPLTPLDPSQMMGNLLYKREDLTLTKAYKLRGAVVGMAYAMETLGYQKFLTVSTGNHALGVLKAAEHLKPEHLRLVVPYNTSAYKLALLKERIEALQDGGVPCALLVEGNTFDEAKGWAMQNRSDGEYYLDPYQDPWVVAGQGTLGLELAQQVLDFLDINSEDGMNEPASSQQGMMQNPMTQDNPEAPATGTLGNFKKLSFTHLHLLSPVGGGGLLAGAMVGLLGGLKEKTLALPCPQRLLLENLLNHTQCHGVRLSDLNAPSGDAIRVQSEATSNQEVLDFFSVERSLVQEEEMVKGQAFVHYDLSSPVEGASGGALTPYFQDFNAFQHLNPVSQDSEEKEAGSKRGPRGRNENNPAFFQTLYLVILSGGNLSPPSKSL
jgi:hypothetical protein